MFFRVHIEIFTIFELLPKLLFDKNTTHRKKKFGGASRGI